MLHTNECCSFSPKPSGSQNTWMTKLPNRLLSELTIPGTHDSCCKDAVNTNLQTQVWSIEHQLEAGIRYFDLRCRHVSNKFKIYHWTFDCGVTFKEVIASLRLFLLTNPREAIIVRIKEEYIADGSSRTFLETFEEEFTPHTDIFYATEHIPYLDEVRGKIWPIFDFPYQYGYKWSDMNLQDHWDIKDNEDIETKVSHIRLHFERSIVNIDRQKLFINHCSGTGHLWPDEVAKRTNKISFDYSGRLGIVVFDYPSEDIIHHLICQNSYLITTCDEVPNEFLINQIASTAAIKVGENK
jgi:1-phosphatidylinositol phosphodiesterase